LNLYGFAENQSINEIDKLGQHICIQADKGEYLFTLDDGTNVVTTITAKEAYRLQYQWFEPEADNYHRLIAVSKDFQESNAVKHVTWDSIATFSLISRFSVQYRQGGAGDWKKLPQGGDGYLLVDVEGAPYWADAIGQIPFAVDTTKKKLLEKFEKEHKKFGNGDYGVTASWPGASWINAGVFREVIATAIDHASGNLVPGNTKVEGNNYDIYMVSRGIKWALKKHKLNYQWGRFYDTYSIIEQPTPSPKELSNPVGKTYP
jgi:hypothetical protein